MEHIANSISERMFNDGYMNKLKPAKLKSGQPRSEREELLLKFRTKLNADRKLAKISDLTDARVATMFKGYPTDRLHELFEELSKPGVRQFGSVLKKKLDAFHKGV